MAEITNKVLQLEFSTSAGKSLKLTINKPAPDLTGEVVSGVMDEILATNALGDGDLVAKKVGAKYIVQEETALTI